ncbi:MAG: TMEM165/GDT1 family protein [Anaerolineae bacterium]|nr:TMEM165/GDT1 family protein [Anaerolineae bacterium]NIN96892.1 TMEM165/GDT1 family protein [Anaerolineae bacterium]NIQ82746.1 TMEM165/GDT1 family protein [Anaerolineae bacterium]
MDWRVVVTTFGLIFLAELGDKTQLAAIAMAAESQTPLAVFVGAVLGLALVTLLGVAIGGTLTRVIPAQYIRMGAGALFILVGAFMLISRGS